MLMINLRKKTLGDGINMSSKVIVVTAHSATSIESSIRIQHVVRYTLAGNVAVTTLLIGDILYVATMEKKNETKFSQ